MKLVPHLAVVTALGAIALGVAGWRTGDFSALWLTPDQQGRLAYENLEFAEAADLFEDPMWKATAAYAAGRYTEAADTFGRIPSAEGFYNRGNALLKGNCRLRAGRRRGTGVDRGGRKPAVGEIHPRLHRKIARTIRYRR